MAEGRFVSRSISQNEQLAGVSLEADYLFGRCIPHLDRDGRMVGNPALVKAIACPLRAEITPAIVPSLLTQLVDAGLVLWYKADGKQVLEFPKFREHQRGMKYDREAASRLPSSTSKDALPVVSDQGGVDPAEVLSRSGPRPPEGKGREGKGREVKNHAKSVTKTTWLTPYWTAWIERYGGKPNAGQLSRALKPLHDEHGETETLRRWDHYLSRTEASYVNPARFAATWGDWAPEVEPKSTVGFDEGDFHRAKR